LFILGFIWCFRSKYHRMGYSNAKLAIALYNCHDGPEMSTKLRNAAYINDRTSGRAIFMDSSRLKIGKNSFNNRLNCMRSVKFKWTNGIAEHGLRINLKKSFYPDFTWWQNISLTSYCFNINSQLLTLYLWHCITIIVRPCHSTSMILGLKLLKSFVNISLYLMELQKI